MTDDTSVQIYQSGSGVELARIDGSGSPIAGPTQVAAATESAALSPGPAGNVLVAARESAGVIVTKVALSPIGPVASHALDSYGSAPALASSPSEYAATWLHVSPGTSEVRFASSADGSSWSSSLSVASASAGARAGVAYSPSGAVVVIADGGTLSLYAKSGAGFLPPVVISQIQGNTFSLVGQPLSVSYKRPQGVFVAIDAGSGFVSTKVASNQESEPSIGVTANGLVLSTASNKGVIRRHMQNDTWSAPIIEIGQPGAFGPQIGEKSGPSRNGLIWASPAGGGSELRSAALDVSPPTGQWLTPPERSVIGGVVSLSLVITDDVAIATEPTYYIAPESAPPDELGTNIDHIRGPPPWVPGPPPTQPPPGAGGGGGGSGNPPPAAANPEPPPPAISDADQGVVYQRDFDTRQVPDGEYRFAATAEDTSLNQMRAILDPVIDNTSPTVGIDLPVTDTLVTSSVGVFGTVTDVTLAGWQLRAETTSTAPVVIASGTTPVISDLLGTFETSMLPASYSGYVYLVLDATDSVESSPNTASYTRRIQADDPRDAFGFLRNSPSYEISATVPITADISGDVASWQLDAFKAGEATPGVTAPSYTNSGSASGSGVVVGQWDVANRWGAGDVSFYLTTIDTAGGDAFADAKVSAFIWRPLELAITSPYLNGELSGTIPIDGYIRGSNVWAWAIGVPISDTNPAFSSDGRRVVFESSRENLFGKDIWIVNTDGSGLTRLTGQPDPYGQPDVSYGGFNGSPSFTPDGKEIVFFSIRSGNHEIYVMNDDGTNVRNLTNNPAHDMFPAVSPDGTKIAFVSDRDGKQQGAIWLMDIDGSNQTLVADVGERSHMPAFSPDGKRLVFYGGTGGIQQIYFVYLTDTANPIQLTTASDALFSANPAYSPDGTRIAFTSPRVLGENPHIYVMNADGTNVVQYTTGTGEDDAVFSPDFGLLAFSSAESGNLEIYLMDANTPLGPKTPLTSQSSIFGIHDRLPGFSPLRYPFPPAPTANTSTKVDVAAFLEGSYQFPVPDQFPAGERPSNGLLGHLDGAKLKPGVNSIELVAIQCPTIPPPFIFRVPRQYEQETSETIAALANCSASSFRQTIRVVVTSAHVEVSFTDNVAGAGYAGPFAVTDTFYARGSWTPPDNWSLGPSPFKPERGPSPALARTSGRMWAKGPPASDGNSYVPVGDPLALEDIKAIMNQPAAGLEALAGTPPTAYPAEQFAPGRIGTRYEVEVPSAPGHFGGTLRIVAWEDTPLGVLGAIQYSYTDFRPGPETDLPGLGQAWGPKKGTEESVGVRIVFSRYNSDEENTVASVPEAGQ